MLVWLSTLLFYIPTSHTPANQNTFLKIPGTWSLLPSLQQLPWCPLLLPWKKKRKWSRSVLSNSLWFYGLYSLPGSSIHGIFQAKILEWVTISFSSAWEWKVKVKLLSRVWLLDPMDCSPPGSSIHGIFQARILEWGAVAFSNTYIYVCMYIYINVCI